MPAGRLESSPLGELVLQSGGDILLVTDDELGLVSVNDMRLIVGLQSAVENIFQSDQTVREQRHSGAQSTHSIVTQSDETASRIDRHSTVEWWLVRMRPHHLCRHIL